jgi:glyoxylase-like metal-dependent hydrolase (beta-lactamase superfamily II)
MSAAVRYQLGAVRLSRVPYFDVPLAPEVVGLTTAQVQATNWAAPAWAQPTGHVLVGQAVWVIESLGRVIVIDPCGAADAFLRTGPEAIGHQDAVLGAMADAGLPADQVDLVLLSHLDGIGMTATVGAEGRWAPAFPNARVILTKAELDRVATAPNVMGAEALAQLVDCGVVDGVETPYRCTEEVTLDLTGAHTPGHAVIRIHSGAARGLLVGHLAIHPVHVASGLCTALHTDPAAAARILDALLAEAVATTALVAGPLWPAPGAGYISGPPYVVTPATPRSPAAQPRPAATGAAGRQ